MDEIVTLSNSVEELMEARTRIDAHLQFVKGAVTQAPNLAVTVVELVAAKSKVRIPEPSLFTSVRSSKKLENFILYIK